MIAKSTCMDVILEPVRSLAMRPHASTEVAGESGQRHVTQSLQQQTLDVSHCHAQCVVDGLCDEASGLVFPETQRDERGFAKRLVNTAQRDRVQRAGEHPATTVALG